jgi:hypothetical protein
VYKHIDRCKTKNEKRSKNGGDWEKSLKRRESAMDCGATTKKKREEQEYSFPKFLLFFDQCVVRMQMMV